MKLKFLVKSLANDELYDNFSLTIKSDLSTYRGTAKSFKTRLDNDIKKDGLSILGEKKVKDFLGNVIYLK